MAAIAAIVGVAGAFTLLLVFGVRLRMFDTQRGRGVFLVVLGLLVVVGAPTVYLLARLDAIHRADHVAAQMSEGLAQTPPDALSEIAAGATPALPAHDASSRSAGSLKLYRGVRAVFIEWCVVGTLAPRHRVSVKIVESRCTP